MARMRIWALANLHAVVPRCRSPSPKLTLLVIVNLQRKIKFDPHTFDQFENKLLSSIVEANKTNVAIALISDRRMKELNSLFRGKKSTTDVLSFPHVPDEFEESGKLKFAEQGAANLSLQGKGFLGDIVISVEQAQKQAEENGLTLEGEIKQLILHGVLHLCGYDHETDKGEMNSRELELREELGI